MHQAFDDYLEHLRQRGKAETARGYITGIQQYDAWLLERDIDPLKATTEDIRSFQRWLATECVSSRGGRLAQSTQATRLSAVKAVYRWLVKRGLLLVDVSKKVRLPRNVRTNVQRAYLSLQEATALLQTQGERVRSLREGSRRWAIEYRNLAFLCLAIATGRRRSGLRNLKVGDVNFDRNEVRYEWEKGKPGRVVPVTEWAMDVVKRYVEQARPRLVNGSDSGWLLLGSKAKQIGKETIREFVQTIHAITVEKNPDLVELGNKTLTPHGLRVSFAKLLFDGGCNIRSVNELMQHSNLSTTATYTPVPLEDLRRACRLAHPRA